MNSVYLYPFNNKYQTRIRENAMSHQSVPKMSLDRPKLKKNLCKVYAASADPDDNYDNRNMIPVFHFC